MQEAQIVPSMSTSYGQPQVVKAPEWSPWLFFACIVVAFILARYRTRLERG